MKFKSSWPNDTMVLEHEQGMLTSVLGSINSLSMNDLWLFGINRHYEHLCDLAVLLELGMSGGQATSAVKLKKKKKKNHLLWSCSIKHQGLEMYISSLPGHNGRHFADDIFKCIFLNENVWISLKISLKFVRKVQINNISALIQIIAWRWPGDKPLSETKMFSLPRHICITWPQWDISLNNVTIVINNGLLLSWQRVYTSMGRDSCSFLIFNSIFLE